MEPVAFTNETAITFGVIVAALVLFIWGRFPAPLVAGGIALFLFFTGILDANETLAGLGDSVIVLIAGLFVVAAGLEASGVTTWAGQQLMERAGASQTKLLLYLMLVAAAFTATISVNGTVVALLPVVVVIAVRLGVPTSQLVLPMCFATHSATMLTLLGAPLNILASNAAKYAGYGEIGFFEFAVAGIPIFLGSIVIMLATRRFLLPHRNGASMPPDLSAHAVTLVEQYRIDDGSTNRLKVRASSPLIGTPRSGLELLSYPGLSLVAVLAPDGKGPAQSSEIREGDLLVVRGDAKAAGQLATDQHLAIREESDGEALAGSLFSRHSGLAEVVIPPRSKLIGETVYPGMAARDGDLLIIAVQRGGEDLGPEPTRLAVGDHLLLQGTWAALDKHLADPQVLVVDSPELVRRQAVPLGLGAKEAIGILVLLIVLLATGVVPAPIAAFLCGGLVVLLGVISLPQAYKSIDWSTLVLIGGTIPLATAMTKTGAAVLIAQFLIDQLGALGPRALLAGLCVATMAITQVISNTAAALLMFPIGIATATAVGVSPMPFIIGIAVGAHAALLSPVGTPVNLIVMAPGGYKFFDYTKFGLPIALWWLVVVAYLVPLYWHF